MSEKKEVMRVVCDKKMPTYSNPFAAGLDLSLDAEAPITFEMGDHATAHTGVSVELPRGTFGLVAIRSGLGMKGLMLSNGIGIIDEDYRGEIRIPLFYHGEETLTVEPGERIAQMVVVPYVQPALKVVNNLSETERGKEGFGSSGRF